MQTIEYKNDNSFNIFLWLFNTAFGIWIRQLLHGLWPSYQRKAKKINSSHLKSISHSRCGMKSHHIWDSLSFPHPQSCPGKRAESQAVLLCFFLQLPVWQLWDAEALSPGKSLSVLPWRLILAQIKRFETKPVCLILNCLYSESAF